jgi:hypothetical protein
MELEKQWKRHFCFCAPIPGDRRREQVATGPGGFTPEGQKLWDFSDDPGVLVPVDRNVSVSLQTKILTRFLLNF